jgi:hypothetical protein
MEIDSPDIETASSVSMSQDGARRINIWDYLFVVAELVIAGMVLYGSTAGYRDGLANRDGRGYSGLAALVGSCGLWIVWLMGAAIRMGTTRPRAITLSIYLVAAAILIVVAWASISMTDSQAEQYDSAFQTWIQANVEPQPIRDWMATLAPSDDVVVLEPQQWPAEIQAMHPKRVDLWRDRGVALTWGKVGHDGDRRQVFIARDRDTAPPDEVLWYGEPEDAWVPIEGDWPGRWREIKPGVWWWILTQA